MRYDFGKVYKEIRESKGLTQEEICGGVLSRTSLSKIESGKTTPKYENMEFLLRQINMSFEEFDISVNFINQVNAQKLCKPISICVPLSEPAILSIYFKNAKTTSRPTTISL